MFVHQVDNSKENAFNAILYRGGEAPTHFHRGFEMIYVARGTLSAQVRGENLAAEEGDAILVAPYVLHSLDMNERSLVFVVVFSGSYAGSLEQKLAGLVPVNPMVRLSPATRNFLCEKWIFAGTGPDGADVANFPTDRLELPAPAAFLLKACIYAVADEVFAATRLVPRGKDNKLVFEMLDYVERNYESDITLHTMAEDLGYDYRYLSRIFKSVLGVGFRTMLNSHRINRAQIMLATTDEPLSRVAMNSGFQSIRSFNRIFREITGVSPSEYRS